MPKSLVSKKKLFRDFSRLNQRYVKKNHLKYLSPRTVAFCKRYDIFERELNFMLWAYDLEFWTLQYAADDYGYSKKKLSERIVFQLVNEGVDAASDFTLTNVTVTNSTTGVTQVLAASVTMDNFVDFVGVGVLYFFTDADSPVDNVDLSSDSGEAAAHNGTGNNAFVFNGFISRKGFDGSIAITQLSINLSNS